MNDDFKFEINQAAVEEIQAKANAVAQDVLRDVNARMQGGDVAAIQQAIEEGLRARGANPNAEGIAEYARSIADGTLKDA